MYELYVICKIKENVTENGLVKKKKKKASLTEKA